MIEFFHRLEYNVTGCRRSMFLKHLRVDMGADKYMSINPVPHDLCVPSSFRIWQITWFHVLGEIRRLIYERIVMCDFVVFDFAIKSKQFDDPGQNDKAQSQPHSTWLSKLNTVCDASSCQLKVNPSIDRVREVLLKPGIQAQRGELAKITEASQHFGAELATRALKEDITHLDL
ncbi:uncharacterized protein BDR25DRAFT_355737 [Lindgomyces ingoldianus]|uniref:Uncharacterized protein n=1 Tax=Lindgomyces ingoldianus TaxID=673940 RepID=A0ACB6QSP8_9PLEO|nr:uncharacterized protein BDR25DRAFT_355737 [Lindgomyces ingoldianus]KAF2470009.1 hypothetical protein BDR25DRAFT_355737 [Lindgomyces ingoldianus]